MVAIDKDISETMKRDAGILLKGVQLWSDLCAMSNDWPSSPLKAQYKTEKTAVTPEEAYNKGEAKRSFQDWLESEPKVFSPRLLV